MENLEQILAEHPFLKGLDPRHLPLLAGCASLINFSSDQMICKEGQKADKFYLVRFGRVAVEIHRARGGSITITTVGEGDVLGWSWLIEPFRWHFDARAIELTRTVALEISCLWRVCEANHDLGYELMKRLARSLAQKLKLIKIKSVDIYGL